MKWDQIESKWALMARRIRADWGDHRIETTETSIQTVKRRDAATPNLADARPFAVKEAESKTSAK